MFDPTTQKVTLSEKHDFDFYNVFEVQDEIGRRVAESLHSRFRSAVPKWSLWSPAKNFQHAEAIAALELVLAARPNLDRAHNRMATICQHIGRLEEARIAHEQSLRSRADIYRSQDPEVIATGANPDERRRAGVTGCVGDAAPR
jgi:tetratricopeptide (TPR) repeat protein